MKTILFILLSFTASAQLEIIEREVIYQDLQMFKIEKEDSLFTIFYKDRQYQEITVIKSFKLYRTQFKQFFDLCTQTIETKQPVSTELYTIKRGLGNAVVYIGNSWFILSRKKIEKILTKTQPYIE